MQPDVMFRNLPASPGVEAAIERWVWRIEALEQLDVCAVTVELQRHGSVAVKVQLRTVTGGWIRVANERERDGDGDVYVAIASAFRLARRAVIDHAAPVRLTA